MITCWNDATGPIYLRIRVINSFSIPFAYIPVFKTINPIGIYPLRSSILATTAAYATFGCFRSSSSMPAVESL